MNITWVPTNEYYRAVIEAADVKEKTDRYVERFLNPWSDMMRMVGAQFGISADDPFGVARVWRWYLPDQLQTAPESLIRLEAEDAWNIGEDALKQAVRRFDGFALPFDSVEGWLMLGVAQQSQPGDQGYAGSVDWTAPRFVCQYFDVTDRNVRALPGAVAHEFNHLVRLRVFPWDMEKTSVADYIVHEGIAESFATALFGEDVLGYYVTDIDPADLLTAKSVIREGLAKTGFNVIRGYVFGDGLAESFGFERVGMPDFGGYAVGYHVVQAYLAKTGKRIEDATYTPAARIVEESGYFRA